MGGDHRPARLDHEAQAFGLAAPLLAAEPARTLPSRHLGAERAYQVQLPDSYDSAPRQRYSLPLPSRQPIGLARAKRP